MPSPNPCSVCCSIWGRRSPAESTLIAGAYSLALCVFQAASGPVLGVGLVLASAFFVGFFCGTQRPVYFVAGAV